MTPTIVYLGESKRFVATSAVLQAQWIPEDHDRGHESNPRWVRSWRLVVWTGLDKFSLYGSDAAALLEAMGQPVHPPKEGPGG